MLFNQPQYYVRTKAHVNHEIPFSKDKNLGSFLITSLENDYTLDVIMIIKEIEDVKKIDLTVHADWSFYIFEIALLAALQMQLK